MKKALFFLKNLPETQQQIVLFLFVGAVNTAFSYCCFAFCIFLGMHYMTAAFVSTCCGILFNFNTTGRIVFNNSNYGLIFKFIAVYLFLYGLNVTFLKLLQVVSDNYYLTEFIAIFPLATISFILNKYIVFKKVVVAI